MSVAHRVFAHWCSYDNLITHRVLRPSVRRAVEMRLQEGTTEDELKQAITRYSELSGRGAAPGWGRWGLFELLTRHGGGYIDRLLDPRWNGFDRKKGATEISESLREAGEEWLKR